MYQQPRLPPQLDVISQEIGTPPGDFKPCLTAFANCRPMRDGRFAPRRLLEPVSKFRRTGAPPGNDKASGLNSGQTASRQGAGPTCSRMTGDCLWPPIHS
jgi:hypothetical protein